MIARVNVGQVDFYLQSSSRVNETTQSVREETMTRETWLNGWPRMGNSVLIGMHVCCAGCGRSHGICTVALSADDKWPEKMPDWPFDEADCPVHNYRQLPAPVDPLTERLKALRERTKP